ncbi:variant erythrocyte surface antigen-1 family protein [Babesia caballi]|uniref:Variant erythrocyte surface antigen-1 family protein n=1 Tax=Babesia caballi TaxID=5871 RepID=A0AAV4LQJ4_BABCB|nr:variant erythrocyte surface antigen-1 family protein [Babesia caballi]
MTGKDGGGGDSSGTKDLASAVEKLLKDVKASSPGLRSTFQNISQAFKSENNNGLINTLGEWLKVFKEGIQESSASKKNVYFELNDSDLIQTVPNAAKIFLGCVPLCFYGLSYLYWRCSLGYLNGGWKTLQLTFKGVGDPALKNYMVGMGYKASELSGIIGQTVVQNVMKDKFEDFKEGISTAGKAASDRSEKEKKAKEKLYPLTSPPAKTASSPPAKATYPEFLTRLSDDASSKISTQITNSAQSHALSILYHISYLYFRGRHIMLSKLPDFKPRPPSTIREMLYFLAALPFSPKHDTLNTHISNHFDSLVPTPLGDTDAERMIPVADSSKSYNHNSPGDTLSAANLKEHLITTCTLSGGVLGIIQGTIESENSDEPWLYNLYSNSQFRFQYPAGTPLFKAIANYAYALHFQLTFLYKQCGSAYSRSCGWQACKYGADINASENSTSHICEGFTCTDLSICKHGHNNHRSGSSCNHNNGGAGKKCGTSGSNSPLQAFLTDKLIGFCLSDQPYPSSPNHLANHPTGAMCHVKMGFVSKTLLKDAGTGNHIYSALSTFCGDAYGPLPQLSEKLGCLTKRVPRTLGDVFGFLWQLTGQMFNKPQLVGKLRDALLSHPNSVDDFINKLKSSLKQISPQLSPEQNGIVKSLNTMAPAIPFLYQLFRVNTDDFLPVTLFNLAQHCHKVENSNGSFKILHNNSSSSSFTSSHNCSSSPNDLWSLYQPVSAAPTGRGVTDSQSACRGKDCGPYLSPLTHSDSATYVPSHASADLSWLAYLTDDCYEWFQNLLDEFKNIDCSKTGCRTSSSGTCSCPKGQHGSGSPQCSCQSVVQCGGVLPLLYRHGFQFMDAKDLKNNTKACTQFDSQLSKVLSPDAPLAKLLESIDSFLYMFRLYFFYNLSSFWLCCFLILLHFIFYGIDVLHVKSHVHFSSSHGIPPIGLLTTGKAPALTKLTYYMP